MEHLGAMHAPFLDFETVSVAGGRREHWRSTKTLAPQERYDA